MKKYSYIHHIICKNCGNSCEKKSKEKQPPKFCSHKCATDSTKVSDKIKWERVIISYNNDVIKKDGCWDWKGHINYKGYARLRASHKNRNSAHRISYEIHNGAIPHGMHILHSCHNPKCTNPDHLRIGTNKDNMADKVKANRQCRGKDSPKSILNEQLVKEIKELLRTTKMTHKEIGKLFGVAKHTISNISVNRCWSHV